MSQVGLSTNVRDRVSGCICTFVNVCRPDALTCKRCMTKLASIVAAIPRAAKPPIANDLGKNRHLPHAFLAGQSVGIGSIGFVKTRLINVYMLLIGGMYAYVESNQLQHDG